MDPLDLHHIIRHPLSRIETNNFQDKSGCSLNGFRSYFFEKGMVRDLEGMERMINNYGSVKKYRGPIFLWIDRINSVQLNDVISRMKKLRFEIQNQSKPIHKLVSPEPHC